MIRVTFRRTSLPYSLVKKVSKVLDATAAAGKRNAIVLTSGTTTTEQLAAMGHPFGRLPTNRGGRGAIRGSLPRLPINDQTGQLQASLFVLPDARFRGVGYKIGFSSPHAVVLTPGGTPNMVARSFWPEWGLRTNRTMKDALRAEFRK